MLTSLMIFHAIVSTLLVILVLLQFGKGAEAGLFSGTSESVFTGTQQGNILSKMTVVLAILFFGNSILLAKLQSKTAAESLLDNEAPIARPLNSDAQDAMKAKADKKAPAPAPTAVKEAKK